MHKRLKFAKDRGFRVLLYFCDGTNSDSGAPHFHKEYLLKDKAGRTMAGWKGPDSVGQASGWIPACRRCGSGIAIISRPCSRNMAPN